MSAACASSAWTNRAVGHVDQSRWTRPRRRRAQRSPEQVPEPTAAAVAWKAKAADDGVNGFSNRLKKIDTAGIERVCRNLTFGVTDAKSRQLIRRLHHAPRVRQEQLARRCETDCAAGSREQRTAECLFELLNALGERWLRHMHLLRGPREVQIVGECHERREPLQ